MDNRIPAANVDKQVDIWFAPVLGADGKVLPCYQKEVKEGKNEKIENLSAYVQNGRLSGEVLEQVYHQAYDEGITQGQASGYKEGHEQGLAKGQQDGYQAGLKQAQLEMQQDMQALQQLIQNLLEPLENQNQIVKNWLYASVTAICESLAVKECENHQSYIVSMVEKAVASLPVGCDYITVYVNPADAECLHKYIHNYQAPWDVKKDEHLSRGSCRVSSGHSEVDFSIQERVRHLLLAIERSDTNAPADMPEAITEDVTEDMTKDITKDMTKVPVDNSQPEGDDVSARH